MIFKIPARSPDLNPIQNFFNIVAKDLKKQAVDNNIRKKNEQFSERIKQTMLAYQMEKINKIIETVGKRVTMVLAAKGIRIRYQEKKKWYYLCHLSNFLVNILFGFSLLPYFLMRIYCFGTLFAFRFGFIAIQRRIQDYHNI